MWNGVVDNIIRFIKTQSVKQKFNWHTNGSVLYYIDDEYDGTYNIFLSAIYYVEYSSRIQLRCSARSLVCAQHMYILYTRVTRAV